MSEFAERVKRWYGLGLWSVKRVRDAMAKGALSAEEFREITGLSE